MSKSLKGFYTVLLDNPPRIQVKWDRITQSDFAGLKIFWWCIGDSLPDNSGLIWDISQFSITAKSGKTYMVTAQAYYRPHSGMPWRSRWAYVVVEVPQEEDKPQYTDLGQVTVIDTPRGPAILLEELWEACG